MASLIRAFLFKTSGVAATPGYFIADTPWAGTKSGAPGDTRYQNSVRLSGGSLQNDPGSLNDVRTLGDRWLDDGTYKVASIHVTASDEAIVTWKIGGSSVGTQDWYSAAVANNVYAEITPIAVTKGLKTWTQEALSKNASSTAYKMPSQTAAIVRTGA